MSIQVEEQQQQQEGQNKQDQEHQQQRSHSGNPYDNSLVMPLADFINHPIAEDLLHNGQTMQVCFEASPKSLQHMPALAAVYACPQHGPATALITHASNDNALAVSIAM